MAERHNRRMAWPGLTSFDFVPAWGGETIKNRAAISTGSWMLHLETTHRLDTKLDGSQAARSSDVRFLSSACISSS